MAKSMEATAKLWRNSPPKQAQLSQREEKRLRDQLEGV